MTSLDDQPWLDRACKGDREAFGQIIRLYHPRVYRLALRLTGDPVSAEDVCQETFLHAYRAISGFDRRSQVGTWLHRICVNVVLSLRRTGRRFTNHLSDTAIAEIPADVEADPVRVIGRTRALARFRDALDALPESQRTTVVLAYLEHLSYKDIGLILGCQEGTVAWRVHEARRALRAALGDADVGLLNNTPAEEDNDGRHA